MWFCVNSLGSKFFFSFEISKSPTWDTWFCKSRNSFLYYFVFFNSPTVFNFYLCFISWHVIRSQNYFMEKLNTLFCQHKGKEKSVWKHYFLSKCHWSLKKNFSFQLVSYVLFFFFMYCSLHVPVCLCLWTLHIVLFCAHVT